MGVLKFIATMVGHVVWPAVALIVVLTFKAPLTKRLGQLKNFTGPGVSMDFDAAEARVQDAVQEDADQKSGSSDPRTSQGRLFKDLPEDLKRAVAEGEHFPAAAMITAWRVMEAELFRARRTTGVVLEKHWDTRTAIDRLGFQGLLSKKERLALVSLQTQRNQAVHGLSNPTPAGAIAYVHLVADMYMAITSNPNWPKDKTSSNKPQPEAS